MYYMAVSRPRTIQGKTTGIRLRTKKDLRKKVKKGPALEEQRLHRNQEEGKQKNGHVVIPVKNQLKNGGFPRRSQKERKKKASQEMAWKEGGALNLKKLGGGGNDG